MRKRYVAKSIPFNSGAVACTSEVVGVADPSDHDQGPRSVQFSFEGGVNFVCGEPARRTNGDEIPLKSPWRRSSRAMVTSA
jgi:hypothetical protein